MDLGEGARLKMAQAPVDVELWNNVCIKMIDALLWDLQDDPSATLKMICRQLRELRAVIVQKLRANEMQR
jgi:hypothetical protein